MTSTPQTAGAGSGSGSATTSFTVPAAGGSEALATVGGQTATLSFSSGAPAGTTLTATSSTTAPSNAPAPSAKARRTESIPGAVPLYYITFTVSQTVPGSVFASEAVTLTAADPTTASYYAEFDDITTAPGTKIVSFGPGTVANGTATITNTGSGTASETSLVSGHTYLLQFYYVPASAASPSPSPSSGGSASPSPSPSSGGSASPSPTSSASPGTSPSPSGSSLPQFTMSGGNDSCEAAPTDGCGPAPNPAYLEAGPLSNGVTIEPGFGTASSASPSPVYLYFQAAATTSQISPSGSFPAFTGTGTVEAYFALNTSTNGAGNTPGGSVSYAQTPTLAVEGLPGSVTQGCALYGYTNANGLTTAWNQIAPMTGVSAVSAGAVTIQPVTMTSAIQVNASQFLGVIACQ